MVSILKFFSR